MAVLYVVATPIGNLEDITFRAVRILTEVGLIAAEDTRRTKILLNKYEIKTPLISYHKFNLNQRTKELMNRLRQGTNIALVSDAGTPGISDPGSELIKAAIEAGIKVEPIPGPSAAITALSVSGLPTDEFVFIGFLPKKPGKKRKALEVLRCDERTIIMYESPYRLLKTLIDIYDILGNRQIAICRELTKKFEEVIRGKTEEVIARLKDRVIKGEVVVVVAGSSQDTQRES